VLDEVVGQIFALQFTFIFLADYFAQPKLIATHLIFCFAFFRLLDIKKPSFIGYADRNFKNGFGVMFDDLICGFVVAVIGFGMILFFR
jgi:phosphatidylglycerophosphatase A